MQSVFREGVVGYEHLLSGFYIGDVFFKKVDIR